MSSLTAFSTWLVEQPEQTVATQMGQDQTTADLLTRVTIWTNTLSQQKGTRWAIYQQDAFEFLAILLALWQLDKVACIPGDNCSGTVTRLQDHVDGFIGGFPNALTVKDDLSPIQWKKLDQKAMALEIYTSGSTGEPQAISKTIQQLERELNTLEQQWPSEKGSVVLTTVSHQHLYGLTFRLLWPFSAGLAFARLSCEYSEDIFNYAVQYSRFILVSSPSHLARMNTTVDWNQLEGQCRYVLSSAAPLSKKDSLHVSQLLNAPVQEIYGSSETGAIAWLTQDDGDNESLWQALPAVTLSANADSILSVDSPYNPEEKPLILSDRVLFHPSNGFELMGRVDSIAKVEGKRVSLTAIDKQLLLNEWVADVKALTLDRKRVETAIVMHLSKAGESQLMLLGRKLFISQLKAYLAHDFEAVVLPKRWRFVDVMPYNGQGKLPLSALQILFDKGPVVKWPKINDIVIENEAATIHCTIPENLLYFDGHFDDEPILPGVVQINWAEILGRQLLEIKGRFKRLEKIKFLQIIAPNSELTITLEYNKVQNRLLFKYQSDQHVLSSGLICFV